MHPIFKKLIPLFIALGLVGLLTYQLLGERGAECSVCVSFGGQRHCAKAVAPTEELARTEAHNSACSRLARGVTEAFACPKVPADEATCKPR